MRLAGQDACESTQERNLAGQGHAHPAGPPGQLEAALGRSQEAWTQDGETAAREANDPAEVP